jgi:DNA-binding NtrC family response regulator
MEELAPLDPHLTAGQRLLVVDDDEDLMELLVDVVGGLGLDVVGATSGEQALQLLEETSPSMVLTDLVMPQMDGAELLRRIKEQNPTTPVIIMSVVSSVQQAVELLHSGADDYLTKPLDFQLLRQRLAALAHTVATARDLEELQQLIDASFHPRVGIIWGTSEAMLRVAAKIPRVARTNASVLVHGESGTGKELVARAVHYASRRARGPMISISCASIPDGLWERELFGHVKGAYSDSGSGGPGMVEAAHEGTLFLDEVGEIPLAIQPKLLRFLQEKEYRPVGSTKLKRADVRIVAATNRDLRAEIKAGRFREDLFYRLNVLQLELPPLRQRKEDLPHLASFFLHRYVEEFEKPAVGFSARALQRLASYDYPGNVRELENVVQQALVSARHSVITAGDVPVGDASITDLDPASPRPEPVAEPVAAPGVEGGGSSLDGLPVNSSQPYNEAKRQLTEAFEQHYVSRVLAANGGNVSRAAEAAGLPRKSFSRIMRRHGIAAGPDGTGGRPGRPRAESVSQE